MSLIILLAVFGGLAYRLVSPEDRERYLAIAMDFVRRLKAATTERGPDDDAFRDALQARTSHVLVTPAIVFISATIVGGMLFGSRAIGDPDTLLAWGASLGTRTTNGEWWRLATSTFVQTGMLHLLVDVAVLLQLGGILERLVGRLAFAAVYLSAGAFTGLVNLSAHPVAVSVAASGAIFGLYGLLLASLIWQVLERRRDHPQTEADEGVAPGVTMPLSVMKRLSVGAAGFLVYSALGGFAHVAEFTGLLIGLMYGLVLARRVSEKAPGTRLVACAMVATGAIAAACAIPLRNIADVKPEIARVLATEERTAAAYQAGLDAFTRGRMTAEALAQLAEGTIMPELQAADARMNALENVPPEHRPLVADAREYLRLRSTSWRARADAIRRTYTDPRRAPEGAASRRLQAEVRFRSNMAAMGNAEGAERASLAAFQRIRRN